MLNGPYRAVCKTTFLLYIVEAGSRWLEKSDVTSRQNLYVPVHVTNTSEVKRNTSRENTSPCSSRKRPLHRDLAGKRRKKHSMGDSRLHTECITTSSSNPVMQSRYWLAPPGVFRFRRAVTVTPRFLHSVVDAMESRC